MWCKRLEKDSWTDAAVAALSRKFIWVYADRDKLPALPKKFNVSAYPTLLVINDKDEMVYRHSGYKKPVPFMKEMVESLTRWQLYKNGKVWDRDAPRAAKIIDEGDITKLPAPNRMIPMGFAWIGEHMWVGQGGKVHCIEPKTGKVTKEVQLPLGVVDICTDGKLLYGLESGWTAGRPIHVIDPETGKTTKQIVTEANKKKRGHGAKGIVCHDGKLYVLEGMRGVINEVDPATGEVTKRLKSGINWLSGLGWDGRNFVTGGRDKVYFIDGESGKSVRDVSVNYRLRSVGFQGDSIWLMEQPIFGYDRNHKRIQVWPKETYIYRLRQKP